MVFIVGAILQTAAQNKEAMFAGRFFAGIGIGMLGLLTPCTYHSFNLLLTHSDTLLSVPVRDRYARTILTTIVPRSLPL